MYRRTLRTVFLAALVTIAAALPALAAPTISVEKPVLDFGTIPQGKKINHVFTLKNTGDAPLTIIRTKTSCGCTVANVSTKTIEPGKSGELKTTFDSASFGGKISKTITIETNDPATPAYTLTIKGTINEDLVVTPRQLNLGQLKAGSSRDFSLTLENRGERTIKIVSVTTPLTQAKAATKKQTIKPGESGQINVTVAPRAEDRFISGFLTIATDSPAKPEITIAVYGSVIK
ncbi:MAG: DUF1573 domain-containing protein [Desulfuromonadales bacterium]|nr:MAG: DUF1573 domain-containing protein [Desulfuromonadales bacterium]